MRKLAMVLMMVFGIGVAAFAGTYKNYEECCKHIWMETTSVYHVDLGKYIAEKFEVTDDIWSGFGRQEEKIMLNNFIQTAAVFNGVITSPTLVNGTDMTMWCFFYKNGKHYKTIVWIFYIPEETK